jgi:hypothetical protein
MARWRTLYDEVAVGPGSHVVEALVESGQITLTVDGVVRTPISGTVPNSWTVAGLYLNAAGATFDWVGVCLPSTST